MNTNQLAQQIGVKLRSHQLTLAVAESCTGGLLGDMITDVPGSSDYFLGGVLAYSNQVKQSLLDVRAETLETHGAVSPQCAAEMAQGVRRLLGSDVALSVTGIAGPGGDTVDKPLGLTYIHLSAPGCEQGMRAVWPGGRRANKMDSALAALQLLQDYLEEGKQ
jgi:PncC family amidohydrolase